MGDLIIRTAKTSTQRRGRNYTKTGIAYFTHWNTNLLYLQVDYVILFISSIIRVYTIVNIHIIGLYVTVRLDPCGMPQVAPHKAVAVTFTRQPFITTLVQNGTQKKYETGPTIFNFSCPGINFYNYYDKSFIIAANNFSQTV